MPQCIDIVHTLFMYMFYEPSIYVGSCSYFQGLRTSIQVNMVITGSFINLRNVHYIVVGPLTSYKG